MGIYWTIQLTIFGACLFELFCKYRTKIKILTLLCVMVALFGGLRWNTGNDWDQYYDIFLRSTWSNIFHFVRYQTGDNAELLEPGFVFLNVFIKSILKTFYWYNIIICGFVQLSYFHFIKYHCPRYPLLLYAVINLAFLYFPVRAGLTVAICLWAYRYIKERKLIPFLLIIAVAASLHNQCLIMFPLYWIGYIKPKWYLYYITVIMMYIVGNIFQDYVVSFSVLLGGDLGEKLATYTDLESEDFGTTGFMNVLLKLFVLSTCLYIIKHSKQGNELWNYTLINIFVICESISFVFLGSNMVNLTRLKDPMSVVQSLLFIYTLGYYFKSKSRVISIFAVLFFVIYYIKQVSALGQGYYFKLTCLPYRTIFE